MKASDVPPEVEIPPCDDSFPVLSADRPNGRAPLAPRYFGTKHRLAVPAVTAKGTMMRDGESKLAQSRRSFPGTRDLENFTHQHAAAIVWLTQES